MAANYARRTLLSSSSSASRILSGCKSSSSSFGAGPSKIGGFAPTKPTSVRVSRYKLSLFSRLPAELGCAQSLMPLHSVTASALLTSKLFLNGGSWGWLSEGFATPV